MAITNLSNQHISASFQYLAQISSSGNIYDGFGNQINSLNLVTSSYVTAQTASFVNPLQQNVVVSGSLRITGSNTLIGTKTITGSVFITGSKTIVGNNTVIGTNIITGSLRITGSNTLIGTKTITGSLLVSNGSSTELAVTVTGVTLGNITTDIHTVTGSLSITGSMSMTGPSIQNAATLLPTLVSGSMEFDGTTFYRTVDSSGRTLNANHHLFYLPTAITHSVAINTSADVFSGSLHAFTMQPNAMYEVLYTVFYQKPTTAGQMSFNVVSSNSWQLANLQYDRTGLAGTGNSFNTGVSAAALAPISQTIINSTGNNVGFNTPTNDTLNSYQRVNIKGLIWNNALSPSSLRLQFQYTALGLIIWPGSYYTIKKMPASSVGVFTA